MAAQPGDLVAILLGYDAPVVLRQAGPESYIILGDALYDGAMQGEAILGPLPWYVERKLVQHNFDPRSPKRRWGWSVFADQRSGQSQLEDPRLGRLPHGWRIVDHLSKDFRLLFEHELLCKTENDPRLELEVLVSRCLKLETIHLL